MASGRLHAAAEAVLLGLVLLAPWPYGAAPDPARYAVCAALLFAGALWSAGRAAEAGGLPAAALPAAAFVGLGAMQAALGISVAPAWTAEASLVLAAMLAALLFWIDRGRDPRAALRLTGTVLAVTLLQAVFGVVQHSLAPGTLYGEPRPWVTSPFGSYANHNHFAGLVGMGAVLAAGLAAARARVDGLGPGAIALGGASLALVAAQLASRSRGGVVALAGGLLLLASLWLAAPTHQPRPRRQRLALAGAGLALLLSVGLVMVPASTRDHLGTIARGGSDLSGGYRLDVARDTLRLALSRPLLGSGLGAYADAFPAFKRGHGHVRTTHAESDALELLAEGGLAGLALAFWLGAVVAHGLAGRVRHGHDPFRKRLALAALAAAGTLLVHSLLDFNLRLPANALVFASLLGLAGAPRQERAWGGRAGPAAAAALLGLLALAAAWRAAGAVAMAGAETADPHRRIARLSSVLARHPYLPEAHRERSLAWRALARRPEGWLASNLDRAVADLHRALALRPLWAEAWAELGDVRHLQGRLAEAEQAHARAVSLDPTHVGVGTARARFLALTRGAEAGVAELLRLRRLNPWWPLADTLAVALPWTRDRTTLLPLAGGDAAGAALLEATLARQPPAAAR